MYSSEHLTLRLTRLKSGDEWSQTRHCLVFLFPKHGGGKCISPKVTHAFVPGDVLLLNGPDAAKVVSSNGEMAFWNFSLALEHLFPLFAGSEIALLQAVSQRLESFKHYPAGSAMAGECHRLLKDVPPQSNLDHRSQLLRVATMVLTDEFNAARNGCAGLMRMEDHLVQTFEQLTTDELLHLPIDQLANRFGCSRRHLNRLFHQYFKSSVASLKMEMRLMKAISLLRDPGSKIISVAEACGFHHLGLFNTCFKKRFGTSPGDWRKRSRSSDSLAEMPLQDAPECSLRISGLCPWARSPALGQLPAPMPPALSDARQGRRFKKPKTRRKRKRPAPGDLTVESNGIDPASGQLTFKAKRSIKPPQNGSH